MAPPDTAKKTILVIDDDRAVRLVTSRFLAERFHVLTAENGEDAVRIAEDHVGEIDVFLTDWVMPGLAGVELARRITALRPGIRGIVMSGLCEEEGPGTEAGCAFLPKPFTRASLLSLVATQLGLPDQPGA